MLNKGKNVFAFLFYNEETEEEKEYRFNIHVETDEQLHSLHLIDRGEDEDFNDFTSDLEDDYGVHDVSFSDKEFYGFRTYEVAPEKYEELMRKWQIFFSDRGYSLSDAP